VGRLSFSHIVTVGTSLLRNASIFYESKGSLSKDTLELMKNCSSLKMEEECARISGLAKKAGSSGNELIDAISDYFDQNKYSCCAEMASMEPFIECALKGKADMKVELLYYSDSGAAEMLSKFFQAKLSGMGIQADIRPINEMKNLWVGLFNLYLTVRELVKRFNSEGHIVMINITPGLKSEVAYSLLGSILSGAPSLAYYRHESMKRTVPIPFFNDRAIYSNAADSIKNALGKSLSSIGADGKILIVSCRLITGNSLCLDEIKGDDVECVKDLANRINLAQP